MTNDNLEWITNWYSQNCNGDWEHNYGVKIETIDNPGWSLEIDLEGTVVEIGNMPWIFVEKSNNDWYGYKVDDGKFIASGDPSKLEYLIDLFRKLIENKYNPLK